MKSRMIKYRGPVQPTELVRAFTCADPADKLVADNDDLFSPGLIQLMTDHRNKFF